MKINTPHQTITTHEGGKAKRINVEQQLRRSVLACMLWEKSFYEEGEEIADRIKGLVVQASRTYVESLALMARRRMKLRHVPLLLICELARTGPVDPETVAAICDRPDQITELLAIYWKDGKKPVRHSMLRGLALAFGRFNEYQLGKYCHRKGKIKLVDALKLCHPKPKDVDQSLLFNKLSEDNLMIPDTWEVQLSADAGKDKKAIWTELMGEKKLGGLALLRNLRNMDQAKVEKTLIRRALNEMSVERILPFRFIAAAKYAPDMEPELEKAMLKAIGDMPKLTGHTILLIDVSFSMQDTVSGKSDLTRLDAACGLAILAREICESVEVWTFSNDVVSVPPRRGFALRDAIVGSQDHQGTWIGKATRKLAERAADRFIVFTDEQAHDSPSDPHTPTGYMLNVASYKNGVGYGRWTNITGFSESSLQYIYDIEADAAE